jgi:RNA-splicing ligase RtcB
MPDVHSGAGCVIGFTANLGDKVVPNLVGVDIGCGMLTVKLGKIEMDLEKLDKVIHEYVPAGFNSHKSPIALFDSIKELKCLKNIPDKNYEAQLGTLGSGNHYVEVDKDDEGNLYLVIHSGSRNLGLQVAKYYQDLAIEDCKNTASYQKEQEELIKRLKKEGKQKQISKELKKLRAKFDKQHPQYPAELCFLTGQHREDYLHDMEIAQEYAKYNRKVMARVILNYIGLGALDQFNFFHTTHNFISFKDNIIRKGAVEAYEGQKLLIPINMRDGSLLCEGKGNPDWNFSAPHGAGRLMSRGQAKSELSLEDFRDTMEGIYTTSVGQSTLDEAPMAYKSLEDIVDNVQDSVRILKIIKPIYNFKSS